MNVHFKESGASDLKIEVLVIMGKLVLVLSKCNEQSQQGFKYSRASNLAVDKLHEAPSEIDIRFKDRDKTWSSVSNST